MPKLIVDGIEVEVPAGATVMQACEAAGKEIPRFCYHERLSIAGNCRMCLVEVEKNPKPVASCAMPAGDGMVIHTDSAKTREAREGVMEFLLINHPLDCPICDQGGECDLQDQSIGYGRGGSRFHENKRAVTEKHMGPLIKTIMTRCIHCTRCVRFAEEIAGVEEIGSLFRGEDMQITSYLEQAVTSELSGNVIDLCPVGALTSKPIAFHARAWELKRTDAIDVTDAIGANITIGSRSGAVIRITPRLNDDVNEEWITDRARFCADGLLERRLDRPWVRVNGKLQPATWAQAFDAIKAASAGLQGDAVAALAGDMAALEEMVALKDLLAGFGSSAHECRLDNAAIGGPRAHWLFNSTLAGIETADVVLLVGTDPRHEATLVNTRLRKGVRKGQTRVFRIGMPVDLTWPVTDLGDDLALLGKLPAEVLEAFANAARPALILGSANATPEVMAAALALTGPLGLVKDGWNGFNLLHAAASRTGALEIGFVADGLKALAPKLLFLLGVDEIDLSPWSESFTVYIGSHGDAGTKTADVILPAAAWAEKNGTYVNLEGRVQRSLRATFPPGDAREDWTIIRALADALGITLPYDNIVQLRARIGKEWPHLVREALHPAAWEAPAESTAAAPSGATRELPPPEHFYQSSPISRASPTMAACVREIVQGQPPLMEAAE